MEVNYHTSIRYYFLYIAYLILLCIMWGTMFFLEEPKLFSVVSIDSWINTLYIMLFWVFGLLSCSNISSLIISGEIGYSRPYQTDRGKYERKWGLVLRYTLPMAIIVGWGYLMLTQIKDLSAVVFNLPDALFNIGLGLVGIVALWHLYFYARILFEVIVCRHQKHN